ncbi:MAG: hypothetical protein N2235_01250 [Fischerella sp.]|nr:hypothetical protein [Fischerella sp.]
MTQNTQYNEPTAKTQTLNYKKRLNSWVVARLLPNTQREIVARFRSRSDADGHLQLLRQRSPEANFVVAFDCQRDEALN